ncbi:MAG: hypothetical protein P8J02_12205 [Yoonia sp.]|nr:hypothetical protein [Yoonia sp.]
MKKQTLGLVALGAVVLLAGAAYQGTHRMGGLHMMMSSVMGERMMHDIAGTPMLIGKDTEVFEVAELRALFENHTALTRTVENLPNGIRTVTETDDADLRDAMTSHIVSMLSRVDEKRDPEIPIQSLTLDVLFEKSEFIVTEINYTATGVEIVQTSDDPEVVAALQTHAAEVSDLAARGMQAAHEAMMARGH